MGEGGLRGGRRLALVDVGKQGFVEGELEESGEVAREGTHL